MNKGNGERGGLVMPAEEAVGFSLRLADGQSWQIRATEETREWAECLARFMELAPGGGGSNAVIRLERTKPHADPGKRPWWRPPEGFPRGGWDVRTSPGLELWRHPEVGETIGALGDYGDTGSVVLQMRYALFPVYERTILNGGLPLHAALVEHEGRAILLGGKSGVGKSTACRRLPPGWKALGDDLALAVRDGGGGWHAHAFPTWSRLMEGDLGASWPTGRAVPLAAVFFLAQAAEDKAVRCGGGASAVALDEAARAILRAVDAISDPVHCPLTRKHVFLNAASLASSLPCFELRLSLAGRFWETIDEALGRCETAKRQDPGIVGRPGNRPRADDPPLRGRPL
jgi:SynChlorMet cassette protein ScmC